MWSSGNKRQVLFLKWPFIVVVDTGTLIGPELTEQAKLAAQ